MSAKKHHVELTPEQRSHVEKIARSNKASIRERARARILLAVDGAQPGGAQKDAAAARASGSCAVTVAYVRARFVLRGLEAALHHREQARRKARKLDGAAEAHLVALVCGAPPEGRKRWSLHLLADQMVAAGFCEDLSHETVRQTLKKTRSSPG
jgi:hypothetical protein